MIDRADVISFAVSKTYRVVDDFGVYACPAKRAHRKVPYVSFRSKNGGHMEAVYPIEEVYEFSPMSPIPENTPVPYRERLQGYIQACKSSFDPADERHRFYLFARGEKIELPHHPRPPKNNPPHYYYRLSDLTGGKEVVQVASIVAKGT